MSSIWQQLFGTNSKIAQSIEGLAPVANPVLQALGQRMVDKMAAEGPAGQLAAEVIGDLAEGVKAPAPVDPPKPVLTFTEDQWSTFTTNLDNGLQAQGLPSSADPVVNGIVAQAATAAGFVVPSTAPVVGDGSGGSTGNPT